MIRGLTACLALTSVAAAEPLTLTRSQQAAAFRAAGFAEVAGQWRKCEDPGASGYLPGSIEQVADLNGDGRPEAIISETSTFCHGATEAGFDLVSQQANGIWRLMASGSGVPIVLARRGVGGWPDIAIGGPGFCFPVERWNGREYRRHRYEYEGKACRP